MMVILSKEIVDKNAKIQMYSMWRMLQPYKGYDF